MKSKLLSHLSGTDWCEILLGITFIHKIEKTRPELAKSVPGNFPEYPKTPRTVSQWRMIISVSTSSGVHPYPENACAIVAYDINGVTSRLEAARAGVTSRGHLPFDIWRSNF